MLDFLNDPQRIHAAAVHLPIALALLGIPLVYLIAVVQDKEILRGLALGWYVLLILAALGSVWTGDRANAQVPTTLPSEVYDVIERHEWMANQVWILAAVTAVFIALSAIRLKWFRGATMALAMIASLATGGWVALTGHYGGELVYGHGVGTPGRVLGQEDSPAAAPGPAPAAPQVSVPAPTTPAPETLPETPPLDTTPETPVAPADPFAPIEPSPTDPFAPIAPENTPFPMPDTSEPAAPPVPPADPATPEASDEAFFPAVRPIDPVEAATISFVRDVQPILDNHCVECHEGDRAKGDFRVTSVAELMLAGRKSGPGVIPFQPDESAIIDYIRGIQKPQMPRRRDPLTEDELHTLRMWIAAGATDDSGSAPAGSAPDTAPASPDDAEPPAVPPAPEFGPSPAGADASSTPEPSRSPAPPGFSAASVARSTHGAEDVLSALPVVAALPVR